MKLDDAIDEVAARLTRVDENDEFGKRIISVLPERQGSWWMMPRLAAGLLTLAGLAALAIVQTNVPANVPPVVLTNVQPNVPPVVLTNVPPVVLTNVQPNVPAVVQSNVRPNDRMNVRPNDRMNVRLNGRLNDRMNAPDHEFSLPSLTPVESLSLTSLSPDTLPEDAALSIAPLAISDLSLDPVQR